MKDIKTAIIPIAGMGTRFLPLSKAIPKELWPLVDQPIIQYLVSEAKNSGIKKIVFVIKTDNKVTLKYLKPCPEIEKHLKERKKEKFLPDLKNLEELLADIDISYVIQKKPLGDGHAILQAKKAIGEEPVVCLFADDIVEAKTPVILQLSNIFKTCQKPVLSLCRIPKEKIPAYGIVAVEKIADRYFKIKKIIEKPPLDKAPSDLAIIGKYILTPEVFDYLKKAKAGPKGEIILAEVLNKMLNDGKLVYGYEIKGKWLECGTKLEWLKSNIYLSLKHPKFGSELAKYIKDNKLI